MPLGRLADGVPVVIVELTHDTTSLSRDVIDSPHSVRPTDGETTPNEHLADLTPRFEVSQDTVGQVFRSIKDVPENHLHETFQIIVKRGGAIVLEGLAQQTSRAISFTKTGKQIRQCLESALNDLLQVGQLRWNGDRIASGSVESTRVTDEQPYAAFKE